MYIILSFILININPYSGIAVCKDIICRLKNSRNLYNNVSIRGTLTKSSQETTALLLKVYPKKKIEIMFIQHKI